MAIGLNLPDEEHFLPSHSGNNNQLRLLHYPPVAVADIHGEGARLTRMPAHSDWGSLTMVFQDNVGGLEVRFDNTDKKLKGKKKRSLNRKQISTPFPPFFINLILFHKLIINVISFRCHTGRRPQPPWKLHPGPTRPQLHNHERR